MTDVERSRWVACHACRSRLPSGTRRCPACGARQPAVGAAARGSGRRAARPRRLRLAAGLAVVGVVTVATAAAVWFFAPPVAPPLEQRSEPAATPPDVPSAPPPAPAPAPAPSRSRGRADWLFFFKPGDWLARMADDALLGVVVRTEKGHRFADGSVGPAYVIQTMDGEERVMDADELERSARLR